jgi:hypothetical protein
MKKVLLLFLVFFSTSLFAQFTIDFETTGQDYDFNVFSTGGDSTDYAVVDNPDPSGINTSSKVGMLTVHSNGDPWAGAWTNSITPFTLTADNAIIKVMVYKDVISDFNLKLEPPNQDHNVPNTVTNQWEELTFDYTAHIGTTVNVLTIIPDFPATRTAGSINYFDNIDFGQGIIPVELTAFKASVSDNGVLLNWTTASEVNNNGFNIERRTDKTIFEKVGFVMGKGTTTESSSYSFLDPHAAGKVYYRLRQIDNDGSFEFSQTIEVDATKLVKFELAQNYPNPFNPSTTIKYSIPDQSFVTIKVFDVLGNEIVKLVNEEKDAGIHQINFNASNLSSGIYYYSISAGNFSATKKFMLMK